jgi:hypothetical protein
LDNPGQEDSPVASAIIRRILLQRTDLLSKYGPERVGAAVDEVADSVGDWDEIGSSDVSGWVRRVEQMLGDMSESSLEEIDRRGFLKGVGAAAVAGAAGSASADWRRGTDYKDPMDDKVYRKFHNTSTDGFADLDYNPDVDSLRFQLKHNSGMFLPKYSHPTGRLRVDNGPVVPVSFAVFGNSKNLVGLYSGDRPVGPETDKLENYILSAKNRILIDVTDLTRTDQKIISFNIQQTRESVDQGVAEGDISQLEKDIAAAPVEPIANMEAQEKIGGRHDADDFDDMVSRLKKLAGSGPMKTVYDPNTRRYKNVPTAVQPPQQPKK